MVYIGLEDLLPFPLLQWPLPGLLRGVDPTLTLVANSSCLELKGREM